MNELNTIIKDLIKNTRGDLGIIRAIQAEDPIYPFSTESKLLAYFLSLKELSYDNFSKISEAYSQRNKYLPLYDMAPRTYGQTWGEQHIRTLFPEFIKATKKNLSKEYPKFDGEFDLWLQGIRIEVKACRANQEKGNGSLASRAYSHSEAKALDFKYHYQQLKPSCCDVFIWIGTCLDNLLYWVISSKELKEIGKMGSQHRNEKTGTSEADVFEGQIFMTEEQLKPFLVDEKDILKVVLKKGKK